jgi:hypothetical protein
MKLTRLSLLLFALVMAVLTVPNAFGAKINVGGGVKKVGHSQGLASGCEGWDYEISCSNGSGACCSGSLGGCWDACEWYCGGPCVYIPY